MITVPYYAPAVKYVGPYVQGPVVTDDMKRARDAIWLGQPRKDICVRIPKVGMIVLRLAKEGEWPFARSYGSDESRMIPVSHSSPYDVKQVPTGELQVWAAPHSIQCLGYAQQ